MGTTTPESDRNITGFCNEAFGMKGLCYFPSTLPSPFIVNPLPHSHALKGRPYPIYLPPRQDSQHEVCHRPLYHSYAGSTKTVLHSENRKAPPQGGVNPESQSLKAHDRINACTSLQENCPCRLEARYASNGTKCLKLPFAHSFVHLSFIEGLACSRP